MVINIENNNLKFDVLNIEKISSDELKLELVANFELDSMSITASVNQLLISDLNIEMVDSNTNILLVNEVDNKLECIVPLNKLKIENMRELNAWKIVMLVKNGEKIEELPIQNKKKCSIDTEHFNYSVQPNSEGILIKRLVLSKSRLLVKEIYQKNNSDILFNIPLHDNYEILSIYLKRRATNFNENSNQKSIVLNYEIKNNNIHAVLCSKELKRVKVSNNDAFDLLVEVKLKNSGFIFESRPKINKQLIENITVFRQQEGFILKPYMTQMDSFAYWVKLDKKQTNKKEVINISVLGSCYSRLAFSTEEYFNPNYKNRYRVGYTHFHSSLISLVSKEVDFEKVKPYLIKKNVHPIHQSYIKTDFQKDFFIKMREEKSDYFLFDLYADASLSLIKWAEDQYTTFSYFYKKFPEFLQDNYKNLSILNHSNSREFLNIWEKSVEKFLKELLKIMPEDRIILVKSRKTIEYKNNNGKILSMDSMYDGNAKEVVKQGNYFFELLENYILDNYPSIKILDVTAEKYVASDNHPQLLSPNHYETAYYKTFMNKLDSIILQDLLERKY